MWISSIRQRDIWLEFVLKQQEQEQQEQQQLYRREMASDSL